MNPDCDAVLGLLPFLEGGSLPAGEASAARVHLASCASCREALEDARRLGATLQEGPLPTPPPLRSARTARPWLWAAAAGLLLAAGIGYRARVQPERESAVPAVPASEEPGLATPGVHEAGPSGLVLALAGEGRLSCVPGTRVHVRENGSPALEGGEAWIHAPGALEVFTRAGALRVSGELLLRDSRREVRTSWLAEACAEDAGGVEVLLLEGARASRGRDAWSGPCRLRFGETVQREPLSEAALSAAFEVRDRAEGAGAWRALPAGPFGSASSRGEPRLERLPEGAGDLVLEVELRVPPGSQAALAYPAGGRTVYTVLGGGTPAPGGWQAYRLRCRGREAELYAGSRRLVSLDRSADGRSISAEPAAGLLAWGPVEVRAFRWRPLGDASK